MPSSPSDETPGASSDSESRLGARPDSGQRPGPDPGRVTQLLNDVCDGDEDAFEDLLPLVYDELRRLARVVRRGRATPTLNTTALVHEAYLKLVPSADARFQNRLHFMRVAGRAMRQVLATAYRRRTAEKRGGDRPHVTLDEQVMGRALPPERMIALEGALQELEVLAPRQAAVVECRFFSGLTIPETAAVLDVSVPTVNRDWRAARAWLRVQLDDEEAGKRSG